MFKKQCPSPSFSIISDIIELKKLRERKLLSIHFSVVVYPLLGKFSLQKYFKRNLKIFALKRRFTFTIFLFGIFFVSLCLKHIQRKYEKCSKLSDPYEEIFFFLFNIFIVREILQMEFL